MKKALPLIIGILAFCLLLGSYFALKKNNQKKEAKEAAKEILYNYNIEDITRLSFTNDENEELTFNLSDGVWNLENSTDVQISTTKLEALLSKVNTLTVTNTLENVEDLESYGLAVPANCVTFTAADTEVVLYIGNYNSTTSSQYVYLNDDTSVIYAVAAELTDVFNVHASSLMEEETDSTQTE